MREWLVNFGNIITLFYVSIRVLKKNYNESKLVSIGQIKFEGTSPLHQRNV